jgi:DNA helicase II / ATP-dependent DNA helicase PcrA
VLNCVDGCIPSDLATGTPAEIEEERRLLYVAMTRAKDSLHLITPLRFYTHGQAKRGDGHVYAARSRFLPDHALREFDVRGWTSPRAADARAARMAPRDLRAQILARYF